MPKTHLEQLNQEEKDLMLFELLTDLLCEADLTDALTLRIRQHLGYESFDSSDIEGIRETINQHKEGEAIIEQALGL